MRAGFEAYLDKTEASPSRHGKNSESGEGGSGEGGSELHKSMLLLLARAYDYKLRTEDLLELTGVSRPSGRQTGSHAVLRKGGREGGTSVIITGSGRFSHRLPACLHD